MEKSAYHKLLEATLKKRPERVGPLTCLVGLELTPERKPFDAWLAVIWSGEAQVPLPEWAVLTFKDIGDRYLSGHVRSLDKAFGFTAGRGQTSELRRRVSHVQHDALCREIWILTLLGYKVIPACRCVARRFQRDAPQIYDELIYDLRPAKGGGAFVGYLRKLYYGWVKANGNTWIPFAEPHWRAWLEKNTDEYLKQFPSD